MRTWRTHKRGVRLVIKRDAWMEGLPGTLPRSTPAEPSKPPRLKGGLKVSGPPEADIQREVEAYVEARGIYYTRIPDSLFRWIYGAGSSVPVWVRAMIGRYLTGQPDLILMKPMGNGKGCFALPLELKRVGGKLSPEQVRTQEAIGTKVAHSTAEAIAFIREFEDLRAT